MARKSIIKVAVMPTADLVPNAFYIKKGVGEEKATLFVTNSTAPITAKSFDYITTGELATELNGVVKTTGAQTVAGIKTFSSSPVVPNATTATQAAAYGQLTSLSSTLQDSIDLKIPLAQKGANNGVATLDAGGKVPAAQLPSYVDDVLEFANLAAFPATGETGKMYVAIDTNQTYRWSGSAYIKISSGDVTEMANFFVRYDAAQSLDSTKQAQARTNIGALGTADLSTYATITGSDARYVRFDASQSLAAPQQAQSRTNIGALGTADLASYVQNTRSILNGTGITGGGTLAADRTLAFDTTWGDARYMRSSLVGYVSTNTTSGAATPLMGAVDADTVPVTSVVISSAFANTPQTAGFLETNVSASSGNFFQMFYGNGIDDAIYWRRKAGSTISSWFRGASTNYVGTQLGNYIAKAGGTMTGALGGTTASFSGTVSAADPTANAHLTTKNYVDNLYALADIWEDGW